LLNQAGTELHRITTTEEENRQGRGEPSREYRKWGTRTPKEDKNQIKPMRKADTRQSKTENGITLIGRTESGALCSDRRDEKSGRRNELKKRPMTCSNRTAAKTKRQERTLGSAK
jgi:hypothetical protein